MVGLSTGLLLSALVSLALLLLNRLFLLVPAALFLPLLMAPQLALWSRLVSTVVGTSTFTRLISCRAAVGSKKIAIPNEGKNTVFIRIAKSHI